MKILPFILLSVLVTGCTSDQQNEEDVIQKEEDIQMQEEEMSRTGSSDEARPDKQDDSLLLPY